MTDLVLDADADAPTVDQLRAAMPDLLDLDRHLEHAHAVVHAGRDVAVAAVTGVDKIVEDGPGSATFPRGF